MNGDGPLHSFDPSAERVSYASVLHGLDTKLSKTWALDEPRRIAANIAKLPELRGK
jgi:hypothetical protein